MNQSQSREFVEVRSEEVEELLTRAPAWFMRWGSLFMFLALSLVFLGAWVVEYPDIVQASFRLTSLNTPKAALARTDGKLVRLFMAEGAPVDSGAVVAYLESTARHEEVLQLADRLEEAWQLAMKGDLEALNGAKLMEYRRLGELQNAFQTFAGAHIQMQTYLANGFYAQKKALLALELRDLQALAQNLREQQQTQERDLKLAQEEYDVQQQLASEKVIAHLELKREESKHIARRIPYQQTASALINNLIAQRAKQKEILELDRLVTEGKNNYLQTLRSLQSAIDTWRARYVVTAPMAGRVHFPASLQENQYVAASQELFYIAPQQTEYFGELRIRQHNFGKVQVGQAVVVKFAGYPYQEFGAVRGRIAAIAEVPVKDSIFVARVRLPEGLATTYGKRLTYKPGMLASAEVITEEHRLIERLFYQLRKVAGDRG